MVSYYLWEVLQTQAFDVILQTLYIVGIWTFITLRLNRIEEKLS